MAEPDDMFDDLDAFFSAASSSNPQHLEQAAQQVAERQSPPAPPRQAVEAASGRPAAPPPAGKGGEAQDQVFDDMDLFGKFIAIEPDAGAAGEGRADEPFILVPAHIHTFLPWWGWLTIGLGLAVLVAGVVITPYVSLNRLTSRLGDTNEANAQYAMRQLVMRGDERTVGKLYDLASSHHEAMPVRLRAVDTLGLINAAAADRALQRLELAGGTHQQVREAAIAARRQRDAARTREQP